MFSSCAECVLLLSDSSVYYTSFGSAKLARIFEIPKYEHINFLILTILRYC